MNKRVIIYLYFLFCSLWSVAQIDTTITEEPSMGYSSEDINFRKKLTTRWILLDLGLDAFRYQNPIYKDSFKTVQPSINFNFHILRQRLFLDKKEKLAVQWGLCFETHRYRFQRFALPTIDTSTSWANTSRNRLFYSTISIPVLISLETNRENMRKSFHFSIGGLFGYRTAASYRYKQDGDKIKASISTKTNPWEMGLRLEMGYGAFNFYANYGLSALFLDKFDIRMLSVGVMVVPF